MEYIGYFLLGILFIFFFVKIFAWPLKILWKLILNGLLGVVLLWLINLLSNTFNFNIAIGINAVTALIAGFFGVPGVIFLVIFKNIL